MAWQDYVNDKYGKKKKQETAESSSPSAASGGGNAAALNAMAAQVNRERLAKAGTWQNHVNQKYGAQATQQRNAQQATQRAMNQQVRSLYDRQQQARQDALDELRSRASLRRDEEQAIQGGTTARVGGDEGIAQDRYSARANAVRARQEAYNRSQETIREARIRQLREQQPVAEATDRTMPSSWDQYIANLQADREAREEAAARREAVAELQARARAIGKVAGAVGGAVSDVAESFRANKAAQGAVDLLKRGAQGAVQGAAQVWGEINRATGRDKAGAVDKFLAENPHGLVDYRNAEVQDAYLDAYKALRDYEGPRDKSQMMDILERGAEIDDRLNMFLNEFGWPEEIDQYYEDKGPGWALGTDRRQAEVKALKTMQMNVMQAQAREREETDRWATLRQMDATSEEALQAMEAAGGEYAAAASAYRRAQEAKQEAQSDPIGQGLVIVDGRMVSRNDLQGPTLAQGAEGIETNLRTEWDKLKRQSVAQASEERAQAESDFYEAQEALRAAWSADYEREAMSEYERLQADEEEKFQALQEDKSRAYRTAYEAAKEKESGADQYLNAYYRVIPLYSDFEEKSAEGPYRRSTEEELAAFRDLEREANATMPMDTQRRNAMTDEELRVANYLYNTRGEAEAEEYMASLERELNARMMAGTEEEARTYGREHPVLATLNHPAYNLANAAAGSLYIAGQAADAMVNHKNFDIDPNSPWFQYGVAKDAMSEGVTSNFGDTGLGKVGKFIYNASMSALESGALGNALFGPAGLAVSGLSALSDGTREAMQRTGNATVAMLEGAAQGALEVVTEKIGGERIIELFGMKDAASIGKAILKSMGSEAIEEIGSEGLGLLTDFFLAGDESEYRQKVRDYERAGMKEEEAARRANMDLIAQIAEAGAGGAWGGLILGGGSAGAAKIFNGAVNLAARSDINKLSKAWGDAATVFRNNWNKDMMPGMYDIAFDALYNGAKEGLSLEDIRRSGGSIVGGLSEAAQETIYTAGQNAAQGVETAQTAQAQQTQKQGETGTVTPMKKLGQAEAMKAAAQPVKDAGAREIAQTAEQAEAEERFQSQTEAQRTAARYDGRTVVPGVVRQYSQQKLSHEQRSQIRILDELGKHYGVEFDVVDSLAGGRANASFAGGKRIAVALNATDQAYVQAGAHELVHYIKSQSEDSYKVLEQLITGALEQTEGYDLGAEIKARIQEYERAGQKLTDAEALEEIVAEAVPTVFTDRAAVRELVEQNRTLAQKVRDFIVDFVDTLRDIATNYMVDADRSEIAALIGETQTLTDIAKAFDSALDVAGEQAQAREAAELEQAASVKSTGIQLQERAKYSAQALDVVDGYINAVDDKVLNAAREYKNDSKAKFRRIKLGEVTTREAEEIKKLTGFDVSGYTHEIDRSGLIHIEKQHGEYGKRDSSMADLNDVARIGWVMNNYDSIRKAEQQNGEEQFSYGYLDKDQKPMPLIQYEKRINGTYYVVEAVGENSWKKLHVISAYINKNGASYMSDIANATPNQTSDNAYTAAPEKSIASATEEVKGAEQNSLRNAGIQVAADGDAAYVKTQTAEQAASVKTETANVKGEYVQKPVEERTFSYDELTAKPDIEMLDIDMTETIDRVEAKKRARQNAKDFANKFDKNGAPMIFVPDLGKYVVIGKNGIGHGMGSDSYGQGPVISRIGEVIKNSVVVLDSDVKDEPDKKNRWTLFTAIPDGKGGVYLVRSLVDQSTRHLIDVTNLHSMKRTENGTSRGLVTSSRGGAQGQSAHTDSTISIAELLSIVKDFYPESISVDVANHFGINRPFNQNYPQRHSMKILENHSKFSMKAPVDTMSLKKAQFELIQRTNPMTDDYHVGIRSESEIKTAEEALGTRDDDEQYVYPDWSWEDGQKALQRGKVTLYSSYPIREGTFVSPSRMMANDYSGGGKVYSKTVSINDVAWINADEGQYAPVDDQPGARFSLNNTSMEPVDTAQVLEGLNGRPAIRISGITDVMEATTVDERAAADQNAQEADSMAEAARTMARAAMQRMAKVGWKQARNYADSLLNQYTSRYDKADMRENMAALLEEIATNGPSQATLNEAAKLARAVIEKSRDTDNSFREQYADLRKRLRETPITLTETQRQEAANIAGDYGAFRRSVFGTFNLAKEGKSLDAIWNEWSDQAPDLFPPDTSEGDMVGVLANVRSQFMPRYMNPYGETIEAASTDLGLQMHEKILGLLGDIEKRDDFRRAIVELRTQFRAEYDAEMLAIKREQREAFDNIASALRQAKATGNREAANKAMTAYRGQLQRVGATQAEAQARLAYRLQYEDRQRRAAAYERIRKTSEALRRMLAKPDKNKHVPMGMQGDVLRVLEAIDFTRNGRKTEGVLAWNASLKNIKEFLAKQLDIQMDRRREEAGHEGLYMTLDEMMVQRLDEAIQTVTRAGKPLSNMTLEELNAFSNAMSIIQHTVNSVNTLWANERHESADELGSQSMSDMQKIRNNAAQNIAGLKTMDNLLNVGMLDAASFFRRLGGTNGAAYSIYEALKKGQSEAFARVREASEATPEILGFTDDNRRTRTQTIRNWAKETHTFEMPRIIKDGKLETETMTMTGTQLMELYALSRREQARKHLLTGGLQIKPEQKTNTLGTVRNMLQNRRDALDKTPVYKITEEQLKSMVNELTDDQKQTVQRMQAYLSSTVSEWGNQVTEKMYLYRMFGEETYWPIVSSRDFLRTKAQNGTVLYNALTNLGMTKQVQEMVSNPILIGDAIETYSGHVSEMATFSGMAMPMDDFLRWYNYAGRDADGRVNFTDSVKQQIRRTIGEDGIKYVQQLMDDLNGMGMTPYVSELLRGALGRFKAAAIAAKLRVAIQQPTAILRASAMVNPKYFTGITQGVGKNTIKEMQEHSALAWWKGNGNYEIGTGQSMKSIITGMQDDMRGDIDEKAGWLAGKMDDLGWATIWQAVKKETAAEHSELEVESDEYWQRVVDRFEDVCMQTQVVDTILTRSQMMRSKDGLMKISTAFMSEPTKNFNLMRNALAEYAQAWSTGDKEGMKRAFGMVARSGGAIVFSQIANAVVTALYDMLRYYNPEDEDEWGEKVSRLNVFLDNFLEDLADGVTPWNMVPVLKDFITIAKGEEVKRSDLQAVTDIVNAVRKLNDYVKNGNSKSLTWWGATRPVIKAVSDIMGLPGSGLIASGELAWNIGANIIVGKGLSNTLDTATSAGAYEALYQAIASGDVKRAEKLRLEMRKGQGGRNAKSSADIDTGVAKQLALQDDRIREYWEKRESGRTAGLKELKRAIMADGFSEEIVMKAVNSYQNAIKNDAKAYYLKAVEQGRTDKAEEYAAKLKSVGVTDEDMAKWTAPAAEDEGLELSAEYTKKNLYAAIRNGEATSAEIKDIMESLRDSSGAEDPMSGIRSGLSSEFKQEYMELIRAGKTSQAAKLRKRLIAAGAKETTIDGWEKEARKK